MCCCRKRVELRTFFIYIYDEGTAGDARETLGEDTKPGINLLGSSVYVFTLVRLVRGSN